MSALDELYKVVHIRSVALLAEKVQVFCVCRGAETPNMVQCDTCLEWYHLNHVRLTQKKLKGVAKYECGYCKDADGGEEQVWTVVPVFMPKRNKVRPPVPTRLTSQTPKALGALRRRPHRGVEGPATWEELVKDISACAQRVRKKLKKLKALAREILKEKGHHIADTVGPGGVEAISLTATVMDAIVGGLDLDEEDPA